MHLFDVETEQGAAEIGRLPLSDLRQLPVLVGNGGVVAALRVAHEVDLLHGLFALAAGSTPLGSQVHEPAAMRLTAYSPG